jgi:heterodisulfide reductase subunit B
MKKYIHYPGCSLKSTGKPYEESLLSLFQALGQPLEELPDWSCCGATTYMAVDELKSFTLSARNIALALTYYGKEAEEIHLIAGCSACYSLLLKTQHYIEEKPEIGVVVKAALREVGLPHEDLHKRVKIRHPLDVLVHDIGLERVKAGVKKPLQGLKVACYYGCLLVRPYSTFDAPYNPMTMDHLVESIGAQPIDWSLKTRCCGGTLSGTIQGAGVRLSYLVLKEARRRGADLVIDACPLCQFNLECFQEQMRTRYHYDIQIPVVYFTQLVGMAFALSDRAIGLQRLFLQPSRAAAAQGG